MADQADMRGGIAEALAESEFPTTDDADAQSWDDWDNEGGAVAPEAAPAAADAEASEAESTTSPEEPEAQEVQDDLPDEYWGVNLEGIPAEQKQAILAHLQQQDSFIQKLQERMAKPDEPVEPTSSTEELAEPTDEELAIALGYDPEDEYNQPSASELKLARTVLALEDQVAAISTQTAAEKAAKDWNRSLDDLESTYGKLPFDRQRVLKYAIDEGIASPFEVYFRITAPGRKQVEDAVRAIRQTEAKKAVGGQVKPRSSAGTTETAPKTGTLREVVAQAMKEAEKETGASWKGIFGRKVQQR